MAAWYVNDVVAYDGNVCELFRGVRLLHTMCRVDDRRVKFWATYTGMKGVAAAGGAVQRGSRHCFFNVACMTT